jgi:hypothetical protein
VGLAVSVADGVAVKVSVSVGLAAFKDKEPATQTPKISRKSLLPKDASMLMKAAV